ncbi:MAG: hypothetical protein Fur0021_02250 [Candidatus Promineifilaceae bacterium]
MLRDLTLPPIRCRQREVWFDEEESIDGDQSSEALASMKELASDWKGAVERATSDPLLRANAVKLYEGW